MLNLRLFCKRIKQNEKLYFNGINTHLIWWNAYDGMKFIIKYIHCIWFSKGVDNRPRVSNANSKYENKLMEFYSSSPWFTPNLIFDSISSLVWLIPWLFQSHSHSHSVSDCAHFGIIHLIHDTYMVWTSVNILLWIANDTHCRHLYSFWLMLLIRTR